MAVKYCIFLATLFALVITHASSADETCFEELGCIPLKDCPRRPLNPAPYPREVINTQFLFFSRDSPENATKIPAHKINSEVLRNVTFDANKRTMMIVHGWIDNVFFGKWMTLMKEALLRHGDYNVILVDWTGGNGLPYTQASVNTRVVGAEMGLLVVKLGQTFGISPSSVHVYGHSLGGHVVGYAGKWLNGTLGRITSLDPAEPLFEYCPANARLAPTDAEFVEVVHTDSYAFVPRFGLGMELPAGDVDYYPNGGQHMPGCDLRDRLVEIREKDILDGVRIVGGCNHMRAVDYVVDFLHNSANNSACHPIAFACQNYELFESGYCTDCGSDGSRCSIMSLEGDEYIRRTKKSNETLRMYFKTSARSPFCLYHYSIEMKIDRNPSNPDIKPLSGTIKIDVNLKNNGSQAFDLKHNADEFTPGALYHYLITSDRPLEDIESITLSYRNSKIFLPPKFYLKFLKFTPMTTTTTRENFKKLSKMYCAQPGGVKSRSSVDLKTDFCSAN